MAAAEIRLWPVAELGLGYRRYRLADEAGERDMVRSLRLHGQITPLVVCRREETLEAVRDKPDLAEGWVGLAEVALGLQRWAEVRECISQLERWGAAEDVARLRQALAQAKRVVP